MNKKIIKLNFVQYFFKLYFDFLVIQKELDLNFFNLFIFYSARCIL